jgi:hypothetical protein
LKTHWAIPGSPDRQANVLTPAPAPAATFATEAFTLDVTVLDLGSGQPVDEVPEEANAAVTAAAPITEPDSASAIEPAGDPPRDAAASVPAFAGTPPRAAAAERSAWSSRQDPTPPPPAWGVLAAAVAMAQRPQPGAPVTPQSDEGSQAMQSGASWLNYVFAVLLLAAVAGAIFVLLKTDAYAALRKHF